MIIYRNSDFTKKKISTLFHYNLIIMKYVLPSTFAYYRARTLIRVDDVVGLDHPLLPRLFACSPVAVGNRKTKPSQETVGI